MAEKRSDRVLAKFEEAEKYAPNFGTYVPSYGCGPS